MFLIYQRLEHHLINGWLAIFLIEMRRVKLCHEVILFVIPSQQACFATWIDEKQQVVKNFDLVYFHVHVVYLINLSVAFFEAPDEHFEFRADAHNLVLGAEFVNAFD